MKQHCIAWKLQEARGGGVHSGPPLRHPEYIVPIKKEVGTPLTREEAEAKAKRMNLYEEFPSCHWAIQYRGEEWKKINERKNKHEIFGDNK